MRGCGREGPAILVICRHNLEPADILFCTLSHRVVDTRDDRQANKKDEASTPVQSVVCVFHDSYLHRQAREITGRRGSDRAVYDDIQAIYHSFSSKGGLSSSFILSFVLVIDRLSESVCVVATTGVQTSGDRPFISDGSITFAYFASLNLSSGRITLINNFDQRPILFLYHHIHTQRSCRLIHSHLAISPLGDRLFYQVSQSLPFHQDYSVQIRRHRLV